MFGHFFNYIAPKRTLDNHHHFDEKEIADAEREIHRQGQGLMNLITAANHSISLTPPSTIPKYKGWTDGPLLLLPCLSLAGLLSSNNPARQGVLNQITSTTYALGGILSQLTSLSAHADWLTKAVSDSRNAWRDPLRFPSAHAGSIDSYDSSYSTAYNVNIFIDELMLSEKKHNGVDSLPPPDAHYEKNIYLQRLMFVLSTVQQAINTNNYDSATFRTIADILADKTRWQQEIYDSDARKVKILNYYIEKEIFAGELYHYLIMKLAESQDNPTDKIKLLTLNLQTRLEKTFATLPLATKQAQKEHVLENIVKSEFPAINNKFHHSIHIPFHWGLCHIGHYFLNKMYLDTTKFTQQENYALGYSLYHLFREGILDNEWTRFFSVPAMNYYLQSPTIDSTALLSENPQQIHEMALNFFFNYSPDIGENANPFLIFHNSLKNYLANGLTNPLPGTEEDRRNADARRKERVIENYLQVDKTLLRVAFAALDPADRKFINDAEIYFGKFVLRLPDRPASTIDNYFSHIVYIQETMLTNPVYLKIFKCKVAEQQRIYALKTSDTAYTVARVDKDFLLYHKLLSDEHKKKYHKNAEVVAAFLPTQLRSVGSKNIKALVLHFVDENLKTLKSHFSQIDRDFESSSEDVSESMEENEQRQERLDALLSLPLVPLRLYGNSTVVNGVSRMSVTDNIPFDLQRLVPYYSHPTAHMITDKPDVERLDAIALHNMVDSFSLSLAAQNAYNQVPSDIKSLYQFNYDLSPGGRKLALSENIANGITSWSEDNATQTIFALDNHSIYKTLLFNAYLGNSINSLKTASEKIHLQTNNVYRRVPYRYQEIFSMEDHIGPDNNINDD